MHDSCANTWGQRVCDFDKRQQKLAPIIHKELLNYVRLCFVTDFARFTSNFESSFCSCTALLLLLARSLRRDAQDRVERQVWIIYADRSC